MPVDISVKDSAFSECYRAIERPHLYPTDIERLLVAVIVAVVRLGCVAVLVGVAASAADGGIEDKRHVLESLLEVQIVEFGKHAALKQSHTNYKYRAVGFMLDDLRIGHDIDRRTVDEYIIVVLAQLCNKLTEAIRFKQLGRIGRYRAYRQHTQIAMLGTGTISPRQSDVLLLR